MSPLQPQKSTSHDTLTLIVASVLYMLSGYVLSLWLGRYLGPVIYGDYGVIITLMTLLNLFQTSGLPLAVTKLVAERNERHGVAIFFQAAKLQLVLAAVLASVLAMIAVPAARFFGNPDLAAYIALSGLVLPGYGLYSLYIGYYAGRHRFAKQAGLNIAYSGAKLIGVLVLTMMWGLHGAIAGFVLAPVVAILVQGFVPRRPATVVPYRVLVGTSWQLVLFAVLLVAMMSVDLFLVKRQFAGVAEPGLYVAAQNVAIVPYLALSAFSQMILPTIATALSNGDTALSATLLRQSLRRLALLLAPLVAFIAAQSDGILRLLYADRYAPASSALSVLVVAYGLLALFNVCGNSINAAGKAMMSVRILVGGLGLTVALCVYAVPQYGMVGAAYSVLAGSVALTIVGMVATRSVIGRVVPVVGLLTAAGSAFVSAACVRLLGLNGQFGLLLGGAVFCLLYCILLLASRAITTDDLRTVARLMRRRYA